MFLNVPDIFLPRGKLTCHAGYYSYYKLNFNAMLVLVKFQNTFLMLLLNYSQNLVSLFVVLPYMISNHFLNTQGINNK